MPLPTIPSGNVTSGLASGFDVANSCRFNDGDSASLSKTMVAGSTDFAKKFTISVWFKLGAISGARPICSFGSGTSNAIDLLIDTNSKATFESWDGSVNPKLATNRLLRDHSAWYNIIIAVDTTQGVAANRIKMYINGTQETSFASSTYPSENYAFPNIASTGDTMKIGNGGQYNSNYFDGYMSEFVYCDGQVLAPTSFGEFDSDSPNIWKPIDVSGLTFGNAGTYVDFQDSGNLGDDESGNTNDLTENNIVAADQSLDSPTNNFCTLNPIGMYPSAGTFSQGNNTWVNATGNYRPHIGTIGLSSGLWYFECKQTQKTSGQEELLGIIGDATQLGTNTSDGSELGYTAYQYAYNATTGNIRNNNGLTSYGIASAQNSILGVYIDLNANKLYFAKDGIVMNSGTGHSIAAASTQPNGVYMPAIAAWSGASHTLNFNFGNGCFGDTAVSSGNADANNYGNFEYAPTGTFDGSTKSFYAICTKNLAEYG